MKTEPKRPGIQQLMDWTKCRQRHQQVLFDFGEVGRRVQDHHAGDLTEMKRRIGGMLQSFKHVMRDQLRKGATGRSLDLQTEFMEDRRTRVTFPLERITKLHEFTVQSLKAARLGQRPSTNPRCVKER